MIIRCWGARGSIPVSGKQYLNYGGNTTCLEIRTKNDDILIVDAGSGIRELGNRLLSEKRYTYTILMTHAHWDHIMGFPFFKPIYSSKTSIDIWGCPFAQTSLKEMLARVMAPPNFPVNFDAINARISYQETCSESYQLGSMTITPIALSHPNQGSGYKFEEDGKCFVFLTDNELGFRHEGGLDYADYLNFSRGADLLVHDAEYTEEEYKKTRSWGHSVYKDALKLALEANVKQLGLFHHNQERFDDAVESIVNECHKEIALHGRDLTCFALRQGSELTL
ncbi:MAG: MBL fold metallo-hydrolase [Deltaproteobacteria bacterium HGW-Deltaproteobacteria-10]|nr:MAG: MBL fold metallo-hydrolase [Deltaproteobacteria bacterium HGW-Deltaproteobacteria-10]